LFIYSGTPAFGNPPVFCAVVPGTTADPFGNALPLVGGSDPVVEIGDMTGAHVGFDISGDQVLHAASGAELWLIPGNPSLEIYDAAANLVESVSATDHGNVKKGLVSYQAGAVTTFAQLLEGALRLVQAGSPTFPPDVSGNGTDLILNSGSTGSNGTQIAVGETAGITIQTQAGAPPSPLLDVEGTALINGVLELSDHSAPAANAGKSELYSSAGAPRAVNDSGFDGALVTSKTEITSRTVTQTGATQLSGQFTINAGDAQAGSTYRLRCSGTGQWGSTTQQLTLIESLSATNINQVNIANNAFNASDPIDWEMTLELTILTTGAAGTALAMLSWSGNKNNAAATSGNSVQGVRTATGISIDTTVNRTLRLNALWASATGAPTITCDRSSFERIGP
jgi:hypothetical protein